MKVHGRDDEMKLLRNKLRELAKADSGCASPRSVASKDGDEEHAAKYHVGEMILVSGTSGTGKSTLIHKGLEITPQSVDAFSHLASWKINYTAHCQHFPMP